MMGVRQQQDLSWWYVVQGSNNIINVDTVSRQGGAMRQGQDRNMTWIRCQLSRRQVQERGEVL